MKDLLGGKGSGLAEMTNAGLPVPPGFTISTEVCNIYYEKKRKSPAGRSSARSSARSRSSRSRRAELGDGRRTRCSCPSARGAKFSMPGMMDTILNLGLNDAAGRRAEGADAATAASRSTATAASSRCSATSSSRFRQGRVRARVRGGQEGARREARHRPRRGGAARGRRRATRRSCEGRRASDFPQDPREQLQRARATPCSAPG